MSAMLKNDQGTISKKFLRRVQSYTQNRYLGLDLPDYIRGECYSVVRARFLNIQFQNPFDY